MVVSLLLFSISAALQREQSRTYSWLQVYQDRSWDISRIVALVVKHVLSISALCREILEVAVLVDTMLLAELLPKLAANCVLSVHDLLARVSCLAPRNVGWY